jgi:hypothetical protein
LLLKITPERYKKKNKSERNGKEKIRVSMYVVVEKKKRCAWSKSSPYEMSNIDEIENEKEQEGKTEASDECRDDGPDRNVTQRSVIGGL